MRDNEWCLDELIPANPLARRSETLDPREPQQTLHRTYGRKTAARSDYETGTLFVTCGSAINWNDVKFAAAAHRKAGVLKTLVLLLDPQLYPDLANELSAKGFERDPLHESFRQREVAVSKSYVKQPRQDTRPELSGEEKLRQAKIETGTLKTHPEPAVLGDFRPRIQ